MIIGKIKGMWQPSHFRSSENNFKGKTAHAHSPVEQTGIALFFPAIHLSLGHGTMVN